MVAARGKMLARERADLLLDSGSGFHDRVLYRQRHKIENMFGRLKDWRRIHTRYDRCANTFTPAICIVVASASGSDLLQVHGASMNGEIRLQRKLSRQALLGCLQRATPRGDLYTLERLGVVITYEDDDVADAYK